MVTLKTALTSQLLLLKRQKYGRNKILQRERKLEEEKNSSSTLIKEGRREKKNFLITQREFFVWVENRNANSIYKWGGVKDEFQIQRPKSFNRYKINCLTSPRKWTIINKVYMRIFFNSHYNITRVPTIHNKIKAKMWTSRLMIKTLAMGFICVCVVVNRDCVVVSVCFICCRSYDLRDI